MPYIGGLDILSLPLRQEVERYLAPNEQVLMCITPKPVIRESLIAKFIIWPFGRKLVPSMHAWVATNRRLVIVHGKKKSEDDYDFRTLSIDYKEINGIKIDSTKDTLYLWVTTGNLKIARITSGGYSTRFEEDYETVDETRGVSGVPIDNLLILDDQAKSHVQQFIAVITDPNRKTSNSSNNVPSASNLTAELMNLARLFRDGYLTQAEFDAAKKQLGL
jgi:hypothetical protein